MKSIFSLFLFLAFCLCEDEIILRFDPNIDLEIPSNSNIISILSPSLHQDALAQKGTFYCHCSLTNWVAFMKLALQDDFELNLEVDEVIKKEFLALRARISAHSSDKNALKKILARQKPSTSIFNPSTLVKIWFSQFRMFFKIVRYRDPLLFLNSAEEAHRIHDGSQIYITGTYYSFHDIIEQYKKFKDDDIILKPQAILRNETRNRIRKYLFGPVDSAFDANLVDLHLLDLHKFFAIMQSLDYTFRNRQVSCQSERIEKYLFLYRGKIRIALPLLVRDKFPFKNPVEILNQLITLLPRYKRLIELYKNFVLKRYDAVIERVNHRERAAMNEESSRYLVDFHETLRQDQLKSIVKDLKSSLGFLNTHNHSNDVNPGTVVANPKTQTRQEPDEMEIQVEEEEAQADAQIEQELRSIAEINEESPHNLIIDEDSDPKLIIDEDAEEDSEPRLIIDEDAEFHQEAQANPQNNPEIQQNACQDVQKKNIIFPRNKRKNYVPQRVQ